MRRVGALGTDFAIQAGVVAALGLAWEIASRSGVASAFMLPSLSSVARRIGEDAQSWSLASDLGLSAYRALAGFAIAAAIGIGMARSAATRWFFDPLVSIGFPMPKIAFLPILVLWFDVYDTSKIIMVAVSCVLPILSAAHAGTQGVDRWPIWSAQSFGARPRGILWRVILPMALPQIITGLQIALPVGLITTIAAEMLTGGEGIGGRMISAGRFADSVGVFAGIVEAALLGIVMTRLLGLVRAKVLAWHAESRT